MGIKTKTATLLLGVVLYFVAAIVFWENATAQETEIEMDGVDIANVMVSCAAANFLIAEIYAVVEDREDDRNSATDRGKMFLLAADHFAPDRDNRSVSVDKFDEFRRMVEEYKQDAFDSIEQLALNECPDIQVNVVEE